MEKYIELQTLLDIDEFISQCGNYATNLSYGDVNKLFNDSVGNEDKIELLVNTLLKVIYDYYKRDSIAYENVTYFVERLSQELTYNLENYIVKYNIVKLLSNFETQKRYDDTSSMVSSTDENAHSGSSVIQSSASTPTGVNPSETGKSMSITMTKNNAEDVDFDYTNNAYGDKYTNFQGMTNGSHSNIVDRDTSITRKGNLKDILELQGMLPKSLYDEVLGDVQKHFIFVY